jgi:hypothetical protein
METAKDNGMEIIQAFAAGVEMIAAVYVLLEVIL